MGTKTYSIKDHMLTSDGPVHVCFKYRNKCDLCGATNVFVLHMATTQECLVSFHPRTGQQMVESYSTEPANVFKVCCFDCIRKGHEHAVAGGGA